MKQVFFIALLAVVATAKANQTSKLDILPDAPGWEYRQVYKLPPTFEKSNPLDTAISLGERNLNWLKYMNSFRDDNHKLRLTKPGDLKGIPIESPKTYSNKTVAKDYDDIKAKMPEALKAVLYSNVSLPKDLPVDEETYVLWANKVDKNYQTAVRWKLNTPYLPFLEQRRENDLRGFYFLSKKTENVESFLRSYATLDAEKQKTAHTWLEQMCTNNEGLRANCAKIIDDAIQANQAYETYMKYLPKSQEIWDSYFSLHNPRPEIVWSQSNPMKMVVPFQDPNDEKILSFLKVNIEDEWKWDQWHLNLDFRSSADIHVEFQSGVTPHVNDVGGDTITMDENAPLSEWDVQWTIRHEFGHVLGFVDCYEEFYDSREGAITTYQLDIDNLMCARSGRMQKLHYETLKASYLK